MRVTAPAASSPAVRARMQAQAVHDTGPEVDLRHWLHVAGMRFRTHVRPVGGLRRQADVVFPRERVAVFVDGDFWHRCPVHYRPPKANREWWEAKIARNVARDRETDDALRAAGWLPIRVWEHEDMLVSSFYVRDVVISRRLA